MQFGKIFSAVFFQHANETEQAPFISKADLCAALNAIARDNLPSVSAGLSFLYFILAGCHAVLLPATMAIPMIAVAGLTGIAFLLLRWALQCRHCRFGFSELLASSLFASRASTHHQYSSAHHRCWIFFPFNGMVHDGRINFAWWLGSNGLAVTAIAGVVTFRHCALYGYGACSAASHRSGAHINTAGKATFAG
jgi:hypothetical protein